MTRAVPDPMDFKPNLTPEQMIRSGMFGGVYFRRKELFDPRELPQDWFVGLEPAFYDSPVWVASNNKFGVWAGSTQSAWEDAGWIRPQDPRGWVQWYFRWWQGRRTEDDVRQQARWMNFASITQGRWSNMLYGKVHKAGATYDDASISPVIRQSLHHWAYEANAEDYATWRSMKGFD